MKSDSYPRLFKMVGTFALGTMLNLAAAATPALAADASANNPASARNAGNTDASAANRSPGDLQRLEELNLLSAALIEKAGSGSTPAHAFRVEARMYRELLRQTMISNRVQTTKDQLPQQLLLDMVRMSALLHSAAACKTGFVITCPADLMRQLESQQAKVTQVLNMFQMMRD